MDANRNESRQLGVLVVGVGYLGSRRALAAKAACNTRLIAVTDPDVSRAQSVANRLDVPAISSLDEALSRNDVDLVIVASPHADHEETVRRSLDAGKAVLCEKPLTTDPDEACDLASRADALGIRLSTGFNHRFYPPVAEALQLVSSWKIGRVESVKLTIGHAASPEFLAGWHADRAVSGGGTMMDNGVHACDLARKFLGEIVAAKGYVRDSIGLPFGIESEAFALFRDHERGVAEVCSSWTLKHGYLTIEVQGSCGFLKVETAPWKLTGRLADGSRLDRRFLRERVSEAIFRRRYGCERSLVTELEQVALYDIHTQSHNATGWDGARATEMADAVYRAAATGSEILLSHPVITVPSGRLVPQEAMSR